MTATFFSFETRRLGDLLFKVSGHGDVIMIYAWNIAWGEGELRFFNDPADAHIWIEYMSQRYV